MGSLLRWIGSLFLTLIVVCGLSGGAAAQGGALAVAGKARLWAADDPSVLPLMPVAGQTLWQSENAAQPDPASAGIPADLGDWTRIAFQSYRDGNWEIYLARGDAAAPQRLTYHDAADIRPRLNHGADRIAFVSNRGGNYDIHTMNADGSNVHRLTHHGLSDSYPAWSPDGRHIAFARFQDDDWEIYRMAADGAGQWRLTYGGGPDLMPTWSPDGRQIAWAQRGGGNTARLMVMDANGDNPRAITPYLKYLEYPSWSPDGSQIAFDYDADGDDWNELAVIQSDGGALRVVYDPGGYLVDVWMGGWAPDGTKLLGSLILYVVQNNQLYYLATGPVQVNLADGVASLLPGSGADMHFDWQTADRWPPISSMTALPPQSPAPFTVSWSGTDMGPAGIAGYDVQVREDPSAVWADWQTGTLATSAAYPGIGGRTYYFRVRARDGAGHVEAWRATPDAQTTVEAMPPVAEVAALPPYMRNGSPIRWGGYDPGGSGIRSYDVQYRDLAAGGWTDWLQGVSYAVDDFYGTAGHTYVFRVRATDNAQNVGVWAVGSEDASTTLYTWAITGTVTSNLGKPILGATIAALPSALLTISNTLDGAYAAYVAAASPTYTVTWSKPGYIEMPPTPFDRIADAQMDVVLPPADNVVQDWGFESADSASSWTRGGLISPVTARAARHTGSYGAWLGQQSPTFAVPVNLSADLSAAVRPQAVLDAGGTLHAIWQGWTAGAWGIYYASRTPDGIWSASVNLAASSDSYGLAPLILDRRGVVHALWSYGPERTIYYTYRNLNGVWASVEAIPGMFAEAWAIDSAGRVHVAGFTSAPGPYELYVAYRRRTPDGVWSPPVDLAGPTTYASGLHIAVDHLGNAHIAFGIHSIGYVFCAREGVCSPAQDISSGRLTDGAAMRFMAVDGSDILHLVLRTWSRPIGRLAYLRREIDGVWASPEILEETEAGGFAVDLRDTLHLISLFPDQQTAYYRRKPKDQSWSSPEPIGGSLRVRSPAVAVDPHGTPHVAFFGVADGLHHIYYTRRSDDSAWLAPARASGRLYHPDSTDPPIPPSVLVIDGHGQPNILWIHYTPVGPSVLQEVFYAGPGGASETADSHLRQTVSIPTALSLPTLSFLYRFGRSGLGTGSRLEAALQDPIATTAIFSTTAVTADWTHHWFDLSPWSGQTVTLTFNVHQQAGGPGAWAYLDEVTVGSGAHPDLWTAARIQVAAPGQAVTFTLTYGNRGEILARGVMLTATLPTGLTFVAADPLPGVSGSTVTWNLGDLLAGTGPRAVTLVAAVNAAATPGSILSRVVEIASVTSETETANNTAGLEVYVGGARRYLPLAGSQ